MVNNQESISAITKRWTVVWMSKGKSPAKIPCMLEVVAPSFSPAQGKGANILDFKAIFES